MVREPPSYGDEDMLSQKDQSKSDRPNIPTSPKEINQKSLKKK